MELAHCLPDEATIVVLGWPELIGAALPRRGDLEVLVVDVHQEGGGLVMQLVDADVNALDAHHGTPLDEARRLKNKIVEDLLLKHGATAGTRR